MCKSAGDRISEYQANEYLVMLDLQRGRLVEARERCQELLTLGDKLREGSVWPAQRYGRGTSPSAGPTTATAGARCARRLHDRGAGRTPLGQALTDADLATMIEDASGCMALHRVNWNRSLLSMDGRELLCHFSARRRTPNPSASPGGRAWRLSNGSGRSASIAPEPGGYWAASQRYAPGLALAASSTRIF